MRNKRMDKNEGMGWASYLQQEHVLKGQIAHAVVCGLRMPLSGFPPWAGQVFLALIPIIPQPSSLGIRAIMNMLQCCRDFVYGQFWGQFMARFRGACSRHVSLLWFAKREKQGQLCHGKLLLTGGGIRICRLYKDKQHRLKAQSSLKSQSFQEFLSILMGY